MKISLDVEGVLADIHKLWVDEYNKRYGTEFMIEDISQWGFEDTKWGIGPSEFKHWIGRIWKKRWRGIPTTETNLSAKIRRLYERHEVNIVTMHGEVSDEIVSWLKLNNIPYKRFISFIAGNHSRKIDLDYSIYVDDCPLLAEAIVKYNHSHSKANKVLYLYSRPYNWTAMESDSVVRIRSFDELLHLL